MIFETRELFRKYTDDATFARIKEYDTVGEMWALCAAEYADTPAIEDDGRVFTYAQLEDDVAHFRTSLAAAGVKAGTRVGLLSPNSYEFVKAFLAITTLGATAVILPAQLDAGTVFGCSMKFGLSALVAHPALWDNTAVAAARRPDLPILSAADTAKDATAAVPCDKTTPCVIMFTGGTTGQSKGALLSNGAVMQGTVNGCYGTKDVFGQRYLLVLPLSHVFGLIRNLMTSLYTGSTLFICRNNKDMFRDIAMFRPTIMVMVPALAEMALTLSKKFGRNMLGDDLKVIICGAAAAPPYLVKEYDKIGVALLQGYGLTESANLVSGNPESLQKPTSVGIPYPHQEFRIEDGELWIKGANMLEDYVGEPESAYEDGWFKTGDLVRMDDEGYLYITGRIKEIIVLANGENVSPAEVETHFNALPFVQDSQVFEAVNDEGSHFLALEIVPRATEAGGMTKEQMIAELEAVNATLPPYQRVNRIVVRDTDFERTPAMKIKRYKLEG
ncbi:MAG: acyl--CoA ligase [Clostridia bacterium]|nr:acyl--CoA ligase [Clostridia bacterium]